MVSPKNPTKYLGPDVYLANIVVRNRAPTSADYRQPETGKNYVIFTGWQVGKDPTTGTEGDLWLLSKIVANVAYWLQITSGVTPSGSVLSISDTANTPVYPTVGGNIQLQGTAGQINILSVPGSNKLTFSLPGGAGAVDSIGVQSASAPGVNPVSADGSGLITINGAVVANHSVVLESRSRALNTLNLEVQYATTAASTDGTKSGVAHYDSGVFSVDSTGFVSLPGGNSPVPQKFNIDANTGPGTDPVVASALGVINITGAQVAAAGVGTNVIRTNSLAANSYTIEIQRSKTESISTVASNGVSHFDSLQFSVDSNGFVSLPGDTATFLPGFAFGGGSTGITYTTQDGRYTRLGNMIFFSIYIDMSNKGSSTGNVTITGLPFNVGGISSQVVFCQLDDVTYSAGYDAPFLRPLTGSSKTAEIWESGSGVISNNLNNTHFTNNSNIRTQGFYFL